VDISCEAEIADDLGSELAETFGGGVEFIPGGLRLYFDSLEFGEKRPLLERILKPAEVPDRWGRPITWFPTEVADEDWSETWKIHFKPMRVGGRFLITPTWEEVSPGPRDLVIRIDPGRAFGTGHHETTRLCLEWLERWSEQQGAGPKVLARSLLDVGTGSGILSIGAALLGFDNIIGVDNDPEAVEVAGPNVELNRFSEKIQVLCGSVDDIDGVFDVVISNIQSLPLIGMSKELISKVREGGKLVLSGILAEQAEDVRTAFEKGGAVLTVMHAAGEWVLLDFEIPKRITNE